MSMAVIVAVGAGLLGRTVGNLIDVDAGFETARLLTFSISLPQVNYPQPVARASWTSMACARSQASTTHPRCGTASAAAAERQRHRNRELHGTSGGSLRGRWDYYQGVMSSYLRRWAFR